MAMLSDDDLDIRDLSDEELSLAWDLWFDLAQATNDADPPHTHGVFQLARAPERDREIHDTPGAAAGDRGETV